MAILGIFLLLIVGIPLAAIVDRLVYVKIAGLSGPALLVPLQSAAFLLFQQSNRTERPDLLNWLLAPVSYVVLAAVGLSVVPFEPGFVPVHLDVGIVLWGMCEALTVVVVFLHGWSANAPLPLIGAYRYVAIGLPVVLLSMFVLIGAALPAQSLSIPAIVDSQRTLINAVRQPLGLPLFLMLGLSVSLRGPFDYGDSSDLASGTAAEISGSARLGWCVAKLAMLVSFSAMAATIFLGGYLGLLLPGPLWLLIKTAAVLIVMVVAGQVFARTPVSRMLTLLWVVLLPLAFLDLLIAGLGAMR